MRTKILILMELSALEPDIRSFGGVDSVCQMHLEGLRRHGDREVDYVILGFNPANDLASNGEVHALAPNIELHWYNYDRRAGLGRLVPNVACNEWLVRRFIKRQRPDVVHSHNPAWGIFRYCDARKVLTLHSYQEIGRTSVGLLNDFFYETLLPAKSIGAADTVSSVSREIVDQLDRRHRTGAIHLPNPFIAGYSGIRRDLAGLPDVNLLMIGNAVPLKRILDGLEVMRRLKPRYPNLHLYVAGRYKPHDPYCRSLRDYALSNGLRDNVHFLGRLDAASLRHRLSETHIGLSLSESESFGLAPLEMMAAGVPTITTEVGVIRWHQDALQARGLDIVRPGDTTAIANAIEARIRDHAYTISAELGAYVKTAFSLRDYVVRTEALYRSSVSSRASVPRAVDLSEHAL
jgi:polysaccharide biosynthesis protein VpsD